MTAKASAPALWQVLASTRASERRGLRFAGTAAIQLHLDEISHPAAFRRVFRL